MHVQIDFAVRFFFEEILHLQKETALYGKVAGGVEEIKILGHVSCQIPETAAGNRTARHRRAESHVSVGVDIRSKSGSRDKLSGRATVLGEIHLASAR